MTLKKEFHPMSNHNMSMCDFLPYFPRHFYIHNSTIPILCTLYSWMCCSYISYAISMAIWSVGWKYTWSEKVKVWPVARWNCGYGSGCCRCDVIVQLQQNTDYWCCTSYGSSKLMIISTLLGQVTLFQDFDWPKSLSHIETLWLLIE